MQFILPWNLSWIVRIARAVLLILEFRDNTTTFIYIYSVCSSQQFAFLHLEISLNFKNTHTLSGKRIQTNITMGSIHTHPHGRSTRFSVGLIENYKIIWKIMKIMLFLDIDKQQLLKEITIIVLSFPLESSRTLSNITSICVQ